MAGRLEPRRREEFPELESAPRDYAEKVLPGENWQIGKHGH